MPRRNKGNDADCDDCEGTQASLSGTDACEALLTRISKSSATTGKGSEGLAFMRFCFSSSVKSLSMSLAFFFRAPAAHTKCSCETEVKREFSR